MIRIGTLAFVTGLVALGCSTASVKPPPPHPAAITRPVVTVSFPKNEEVDVVYRLYSLGEDRDQILQSLFSGIVLSLPESPAQIAYKLFLIDAAWKRHFGVTTASGNAILISSSLCLAETDHGTDDWSFDFRQFSSSDPPGSLKFKENQLAVSPELRTTDLKFHQRRPEEWGSIYADYYRSYVISNSARF